MNERTTAASCVGDCVWEVPAGFPVVSTSPWAVVLTYGFTATVAGFAKHPCARRRRRVRRHLGVRRHRGGRGMRLALQLRRRGGACDRTARCWCGRASATGMMLTTLLTHTLGGAGPLLSPAWTQATTFAAASNDPRCAAVAAADDNANARSGHVQRAILFYSVVRMNLLSIAITGPCQPIDATPPPTVVVSPSSVAQANTRRK